MLKPKCKFSGRPAFTFSLPGGQFAPLPPVSYATGYDILYLHAVSYPYSIATRYSWWCSLLYGRSCKLSII